MQYILSEEEYQDLVEAKKKAEEAVRDRLQKVCTMAADQIPIKVYWNKKEKEPWGCIHTREMEDGYEWYCDNCPVRKLCPSGKHFSK